MGTYDRSRDTRSPLWAQRYKAKWGIYPIAGGEEAVTFTQEQVTEQVNTAVAEATKAKEGNFFEGFASDLKAHPSITRYKSTEELAKGHVELEKRIGLKGVLVPVDGSSDDVKNDFFKAVGRPEKAELYANPVFDGLHEGVKTTSEQDSKAFKEICFQNGVSAKVFDNIYNKWYLPLQSQRLTDYDKVLTDEKNAAATGLRTKWGGGYDERLALANGMIKKFGSDDLMAKIGSDPAAIEFLYNVGSQLSEDKLLELGGSGMGMSPEQAKIEINKITAQIDATKQDDPTYQDLLNKKNNLYKIAFPDKPK